MKRSPMPRGRGFSRPEPKPVKVIGDGYTVRPRDAAVAVADLSSQLVVPVPKTEYLRDESYRRWVASLNCAHCGRVGRSQAAHADDNGAAGKGMGIKASDAFLYPACADEPGRRGCHHLIGSSGLFSKAMRHHTEARYVAQTRALYAAEFPTRGPAAQPEGASHGNEALPHEVRAADEEGRTARQEVGQEGSLLT